MAADHSLDSGPEKDPAMKLLALLVVLLGALLGTLQEARDELDLGAGRLLRGTIVKETAEQYFVDLGPTIVTLPRASVLAVRRAAPAGEPGGQVEPPAPGTLFTRAARAELGVRENVERVGEGVVHVKVPSASGSGFVISREGHVVTNAHVILGERNISVTLFLGRGTELRKKVIEKVEILALNPYWDLALLELPEAELAGLELTPIPFGRSSEVRVGEPVFSIGNPLGLERSVSEGIVSTKNREAGGMLYIQTTAPTNPGNSGGPLFNLKGEMIGVVSWHYAFNEGLNFAIPVATVEAFLENRDAFAFDRTNPNSGYLYLAPPRKGGKSRE
jgi:serine protease Do